MRVLKRAGRVVLSKRETARWDSMYSRSLFAQQRASIQAAACHLSIERHGRIPIVGADRRERYAIDLRPVYTEPAFAGGAR